MVQSNKDCICFPRLVLPRWRHLKKKKKKKKNICRVAESEKKPFTLQERWYRWHKMKWISNDQNRDYLPNFKEEKSHISPKAFKIQEAQVTCNTLNELIHSDQEQFPFTTEVKTYSISLNLPIKKTLEIFKDHLGGYLYRHDLHLHNDSCSLLSQNTLQ